MLDAKENRGIVISDMAGKKVEKKSGISIKVSWMVFLQVLVIAVALSGIAAAFNSCVQVSELKVTVTRIEQTLDTTVNRLEQELADANSEADSPEGDATGLASNSSEKETIAFLKEEASKHREFIESERQYLIWQLGLIITGALGILAFLGIKQRKDVEEIIEQNYRKEIDSQLEQFIGGKKAYQYLRESIDRETRIKETEILVITQSELERGLKFAHERLRCNGHKTVDVEKVTSILNTAGYPTNASERYRIWIYEPAFEELEQDSPVYRKIAEHCNNNGIYCVFYWPHQKQLDYKIVYTPYTIPANAELTILERIYGLLNNCIS
jgi:hypothetical protein